MSFVLEITIFLAAAVVAVPLFRLLGLGAVLGYLAAGVLIGPSALGLITDVDSILQLSKIGVVLLLFLVGLELAPRRLWVMRRSIFGLGLLGVTAMRIRSDGGLADDAEWGFKLPEAMLIMPELLAAFPAARLVHLVRHPDSPVLCREGGIGDREVLYVSEVGGPDCTSLGPFRCPKSLGRCL